ncbi:MAG TPA: Spy/CpxP family protein refolding chaperone [Gemmatimonadaceae bacterium]|nr:Spy/CpxP family protein refolding chaperone [Gemmatimonadaceae bacterium]
MTRSIAIAGLALALAAGSIQAQQPQPQGGERGQRQEEMRGMRRGAMQPGRALFRGITLTDAQQAQVKTIQEKYRPQFQTLREEMRSGRDSAGPIPATRAGMQQLMQAQQQELRGVLTADQQRTFDANVKEMRERMAERRGNRNPRGPHARGRS